MKKGDIVYSVIYEKDVKINGIHTDDFGDPIYTCDVELDGETHNILFRKSSLN